MITETKTLEIDSTKSSRIVLDRVQLEVVGDCLRIIGNGKITDIKLKDINIVLGERK